MAGVAPFVVVSLIELKKPSDLQNYYFLIVVFGVKQIDIHAIYDVSIRTSIKYGDD